MQNTTHHSRTWIFWLCMGILLVGFIYLIRAILLPFVVGILLAYFLNPTVEKLEQKGISRYLATMIVIASFFFVIVLGLTLLMPVLFQQLSELFSALPGYISALETQFRPALRSWMSVLAANPARTMQSATAIPAGVLPVAGGMAQGLLHSGIAIANLVALLLITPVVAFHLLYEWDHIVAKVDSLLPRNHAAVIREQVKLIDATLSGFIRGQTNVCILLGIFYAIGLSLVGLQFGAIIGFASAFLAFIPYIGLLAGGLFAVALAYAQFGSLLMMAAVAGVFLLGQFIEGNFITPRLVGGRVGLHPAWIIFGMLAGGSLLGLVGVLIAVPVTAVIGVLVRFMIARYQESTLYSDTPPVPPPTT